MATPYLAAGRLVVDGRPTLLLGGELRNSSASTRRFLEPRWEGIVGSGCTTLLAPVTWEQFEPDEGRFDTTVVDDLLAGARANGLRLVLLWFGSWKNGMSTYVPHWVKRDPRRFGVQHLAGQPTAVLSPFVLANADADAAAFARLMAHLHDQDPEHTVVMVQVENEVGSLGDARDRSPAARAAWADVVPVALLDALRAVPDESTGRLRVQLDPAAPQRPTWEQAFGDGEHAEELFMAWHLATYIEQVAAAGRAEHDIPLFVNAWLNTGGHGGLTAISGGERPGSYPSGGPLPQVAWAWHAAAPSIDFLAPDIYAVDADPWLSQYGASTPTLFVPETRSDAAGIEGIYLAIGEYGAIGTAPFGIDDLSADDRHRLERVYAQLDAIADDIVEAQADGRIRGFVARHDRPTTLTFDRYEFTISADFANPGDGSARENGCGLVIAVNDEEFVFAASGIMLRALTTSGGQTVLHTVQELDPGPASGRSAEQPVRRWLNGDETMNGYFVRIRSQSAPPVGSAASSESSTGLVRFSLLPVATGD